MTSARSLMRLHVEALFTSDAAGRLVAVNEPDGAAAPRFFLGRTADGHEWRFRHDVDAGVAGELVALCESQPIGLAVGPDLGAATPFVDCLSRVEPVRRVWAGPAFYFPAALPAHVTAVRVTAGNAHVLTPYLADWRSDVRRGVPMTAVLEGGAAVSVCCSVRTTARAHEAGVHTLEGFRGRGYATRAAAAWAALVREAGCVPLYSTSWQNEPSRGLARKLGLVQYGVDLHVT